MTSNRRYSAALFCPLLAFILVSCSNNSTDAIPAIPFSLTVHVSHAGGAPAAGLRVAVWNDLSVTSANAAKQMPPERRPQAVTSITFGIPFKCRVRVGIYDILTTQIGSPLVDTVMPAGYYHVNWGIDTTLPIAVLKCVLEARDTATSALLTRKNISLLLYQPDIGTSLNGYTDGTGTFRAYNVTQFPNILPLPLLVYTRDDPTPLGYITIHDSVTVFVRDTASGQYEHYRGKIVEGPNEWTLVFAPGAGTQPGAVEPGPPALGATRRVSLTPNPVVIPQDFVLNQNFPNPFN